MHVVPFPTTRASQGATGHIAPTLSNHDQIQLHTDAHNALAMALFYLRQPDANLQGAARKAVQALAALRRLDAGATSKANQQRQQQGERYESHHHLHTPYGCGLPLPGQRQHRLTGDLHISSNAARHTDLVDLGLHTYAAPVSYQTFTKFTPEQARAIAAELVACADAHAAVMSAGAGAGAAEKGGAV